MYEIAVLRKNRILLKNNGLVIYINCISFLFSDLTDPQLGLDPGRGNKSLNL